MNSVKQFDYLTSLRGIAALWVVFYHISQYLIYYTPDWLMAIIIKGHLAVDFFFVLSGFILTLNYHHIFSDFSFSLYRTFLIKRIARIYPLHLLVLIGYLLIPLSYFLTDRVIPEGEKYSLVNYLMQLGLVNNWGVSDKLSWNIPAWSISTEWAAYICFPIIIALLNRVKTNYIPFLLMTINGVVFFIFLLYGYDSLGQDIQGLGLIRCLLEFFMGAMICKYTQTYSYSNRASYLFLILSFLSILLIVFNIISEIVFGSIVMALSLIAFVNLNESAVATWLRVKPLMLLGEISYSIYLTHFFIKDIFKLIFLQGDVAQPLWIIGYVLTVIVVSYFTYTFFEVPARKTLVAYANKRAALSNVAEREVS